MEKFSRSIVVGNNSHSSFEVHNLNKAASMNSKSDFLNDSNSNCNRKLLAPKVPIPHYQSVMLNKNVKKEMTELRKPDKKVSLCIGLFCLKID